MRREQSKVGYRISRAIWGALAFALALAGVPGRGFAQSQVPAQPEAKWSVRLSGLRADTMSQEYFSKLKAAGSGYLSKTVDKKGATAIYTGVSLRLVMAMVDGPDSAHPFAFDPGLWARGYDITFVAEDGYSASFSTATLSPDALILADTEDGKPLVKPMIVGDGPKSLWVKNITSIETSLSPAALVSEAAAFTLELDINGSLRSFSLAELEKDKDYIEGPGSFTTSAGTKYSNAYGGVKLASLLERYMDLSADDSLTFVATDGYEMTYPGSRVLDSSDGEWILAFRMDGDWLPKNPGYVRTIKVGPGNPNIDGHLSVKMIKRIVVKEKDYADFRLSFSGKMSGELDRGTIQSCVSCHRKDVAFERKDVKANYAGFPLHLLLAYADDAEYAPHKQASGILSYDAAAAKAGYRVEVIAEDGFTITLDSRYLDENDQIILAMYREGKALGAEEFPLVLVWDKGAARLPEGIKNVKRVKAIRLLF
ncbi:MAG TPA: molybdopterin-dependent oxidoreductase [Rectinemataceae bacterium]